MKKRIRNILGIAIIAILVIVVVSVFLLTGNKKDIGPCTDYQCDVKNLRLSTTIEIDKENEDFATIKGNAFAHFRDPLTMYDFEGNKLGYAGDAYRFITQDAHSIYVNDEFSVEMVGLFKIFGESYDIYNKDGKKIANVVFNSFNTHGEMHDTSGNLMADFTSKLFRNDFEVRITEKCDLDEKTILMIFSSYYSDQNADAQRKSNQRKSNNSRKK